MRKLIFILSIFSLCLSCSKEETDNLEKDKLTIEQYIAAHGLVASSTPEGIFYVIDNPGGSTHPTVNSKVKVHYKGYLTNDSVFDKTNGTAVEFYLSTTIKGWQIGIPKFGKGGKGKLLIPSKYGYGNSSVGDIPAGSVLIFDIVLSDFN